MGLTSDDYLHQLQALLPTGHVWPRDPDTDTTRTLQAFADGLARVDGRCDDLTREVFPSGANELLPEYETEYGLPLDPANAPVTYQSRLSALIVQVLATGGSSVTYFTTMAARLGYTVTIDQNVDGNPFLWRVNVQGQPVYQFHAGESQAGDLLLDWDAASTLEGILHILKPAHTRVIYDYA